MSKKRVLVTGMSGLIGSAVLRHLSDKYEFTALNRRDIPGVRCFQMSIADGLEAIQPAFQGQEVVVHLAALVSGSAGWEGILQNNIVGTYNVYEAARRAGVKRIIFASSGSVIAGYHKEEPYKAILEGRYKDVPPTWPMINHRSEVRPGQFYGVSKAFGEALGRFYSDAHGISVINIRFGAVVKEDRPVAPAHFAIWCSQRDAAQMIDKCIQAPDSLKWDIVYCVSNNRWGFRDIQHARESVGYVPQDSAGDYRAS